MPASIIPVFHTGSIKPLHRKRGETCMEALKLHFFLCFRVPILIGMAILQNILQCTNKLLHSKKASARYND